MKNALILLAALAAAVALAFVTWTLLAPAPAPVRPTTPPEVKPRADDFVVEERSAGDQHRVMRAPYPFGDFVEDIELLKSDAGRAAQMAEHQLKHKIDNRIREMRLTIRLKDTTAEQVYSLLTPHFQEAGIKLTNMDKPMPEDRFDIDMENRTAWEVVFHMEDVTRGHVANMLTAEGLCIASPSDCYQWSIDCTKRLHDKHVAHRQRSKLLDTPYRPEFSGADIGGVIKLISGATGVEVVVGPDIWASTKTFTWRGREQKLRDVLVRICGELDAVYEVRDERVYILTR